MQTEEIISPLFFEKLLIKFLFQDKDVQEKILPFLDIEVFDAFETKDIIKIILKFIEEHSKFPSIPEIKLEFKNKESFNCLTECLDIDISEYDREFILNKIEVFFKKKMLLNEFVNGASKLKEDDVSSLNDIPDKIREKLSFSFDTEVGLDIFSEEGKKRFYDHLKTKDNYFPTGFNYLNKFIDGGFHEKTLNLFLAACVDENTKVKIRFKKKN